MKAFIAIRKTWNEDFVIEGAFKTLAIANQCAMDPDYPSSVYVIDFENMKIECLMKEEDHGVNVLL